MIRNLQWKTIPWWKAAAGAALVLAAFWFSGQGPGADAPDAWTLTSHGDVGTVTGAAVGTEPAGATPAAIVVEIAGAVADPGVFELPAGSRLITGVEAAGGLTERADTRDTNLAGKLADGMKLYIPTKEETENAAKASGTKPGAAYADGSTALQSVGADAEGAKVDINHADSAQLQTLHGVGPATADKIIRYRQTNGPFSTIEDLVRVSGIGEKTLEKLRDVITAE